MWLVSCMPATSMSNTLIDERKKDAPIPTKSNNAPPSDAPAVAWLTAPMLTNNTREYQNRSVRFASTSRGREKLNCVTQRQM